MKDRYLAWVPVLLLAALAGLTYWLDQKVRPERGSDVKSQGQPDFVVDDFVATRMALDGTPSYAVRAKRMEHYLEEDSSRLDQPELTHFDPQKAPVSIRADQGLLDKHAENAYFQGHVEVRRQAYADNPEMALYTSYLHVIPELQIAETDKEVKVVSGKNTVEAVGLEFNNKTHTVNLKSRVKGTYATPPKDRRAMPWERRR
jgi:lipopolysaccharide export system protein LptC